MRSVLLLIVLASLLSTGKIHAREYTFGIVPQQSSAKLARLWGPILQKLSADTGLQLKLVTAKNIPTFEKRLAEGKYDFAYMNPYHFTVYSQAPGYVALGHQKNKSIRGIIVVRKDSSAGSLEDLGDSTIAFPAPAAFAATILTQAELNQRAIPFTPRYVSSHDSVYLAVARGLAAAGGGVLRTLKNTDPAVRDQLRIFWKTPKYTPHAFSAHPDVSEQDREKIQNALVVMDTTQEGRDLLQAISFEGIQIAQGSYWDDVRALNITLLDD